MTEPTPTPEQQNSPAAPEENSSTPERDGFFKRVQRVLKPEPPLHPSEAAEIVIDYLPPIKKTASDEQP